MKPGARMASIASTRWRRCSAGYRRLLFVTASTTPRASSWSACSACARPSRPREAQAFRSTRTTWTSSRWPSSPMAVASMSSPASVVSVKGCHRWPRRSRAPRSSSQTSSTSCSFSGGRPVDACRLPAPPELALDLHPTEPVSTVRAPSGWLEGATARGLGAATWPRAGAAGASADRRPPPQPGHGLSNWHFRRDQTGNRGQYIIGRVSTGGRRAESVGTANAILRWMDWGTSSLRMRS